MIVGRDTLTKGIRCIRMSTLMVSRYSYYFQGW